MKGKRLPRKRVPNYGIGERVRINRGPCVGNIGRVIKVAKGFVWVEHSPDWEWRRLTKFTPIALDRVESLRITSNYKSGKKNRRWMKTITRWYE